MTRLVRQTTMSVDGFIAGPGDAMDWVFGYAYDSDEGKPSGGGCEGRWSGPEFVLPHHPPPDAAELPQAFLSGAIGDAMATAAGAITDLRLRFR